MPAGSSPPPARIEQVVARRRAPAGFPPAPPAARWAGSSWWRRTAAGPPAGPAGDDGRRGWGGLGHGGGAAMATGRAAAERRAVRRVTLGIAPMWGCLGLPASTACDPPMIPSLPFMCLKNLYKTSSPLHLDRSSYVLAVACSLTSIAAPVVAEPDLPAGWLLRGQAPSSNRAIPASLPLRGENSMQAKAMQRNTLSADMVLGRELWEGAERIVNPQVSRGFGLSGTRGAAAFPRRGFRTGSEGPALSHRASSDRRGIIRRRGRGEDDPIASRPCAGKLTITPARSQSSISSTTTAMPMIRGPNENGAFVSAGAFDFANDAKGYTNGIAWNGTMVAGACARGDAGGQAHEYPSLDRKPLRGHQILLQADRFFDWGGHPGACDCLAAGRRPARKATRHCLAATWARPKPICAAGRPAS